MTIPQLYRDTTVKALNRYRSIRKAADAMGVSFVTVFRWKREYGITLNEKGEYV